MTWTSACYRVRYSLVDERWGVAHLEDLGTAPGEFAVRDAVWAVVARFPSEVEAHRYVADVIARQNVLLKADPIVGRHTA